MREIAREKFCLVLKKERKKNKGENVYIPVTFPSPLIIMLLSFIRIHYSQCGEPVQVFPVDSFKMDENKLNYCSFSVSLLKSMQLEFQQSLKWHNVI